MIAPNQIAVASTGMTSVRLGCGMNHRQVTTNITSQTTSSTPTAQYGARRPLAAYRKNAATIPIRPTKPHTETLRSLIATGGRY